MFKKQVDKKVAAPESKPEPVVAEEMSAPSDAEELIEEAEDEEAEPVAEGVDTDEELTEESLKVILQKLVSDVNAIKYHLRLDFI